MFDESQSGGFVHKQTTPQNWKARTGQLGHNGHFKCHLSSWSPFFLVTFLLGHGTMASRRGIKPKRFSASSITPLLRTDPSFEPFELANIEMILTSEMINKPWLTKALTVTVDHGKSLTTEDEAT